MSYLRFRSTERRSFYVRVADRPPCSVQLIMPIDRVGIGPARPCMLMCERTSVSPLPVSASSAHRDRHIYEAQFALGVRPTLHREVNMPVSVHVCDKCALQLRANAFERTSARHVTLFDPLSLSLYLDFL